MLRSLTPALTRRRARAVLGLAVAATLLAAIAADAPPSGGFDLDALTAQGKRLTDSGFAWYARTPPADRVTWGGLAAASALAVMVLLERSVRLRRRRTMPDEFAARFLERLQDGRLDRGKALDYCELNPSPASRVALAAVKRWGRPVGDLERAVNLAHRVEADRLRRHVGTLRRIAALTPLIGLLGTLLACSRALDALGQPSATPWGPALASALGPLTAGVGLAILALVAYDGLAGRVEMLVAALDRVGAETIDAIATSLLADPRPPASHPTTSTRTSTAHPASSTRAPHQIRLEIPSPAPRETIEPDDYD